VAHTRSISPILVPIDADSAIRHQHFGQVDDLLLRAQIGDLVGARGAMTQAATELATSAPAGCHDAGDEADSACIR
jgi:hypothetical protein